MANNYLEFSGVIPNLTAGEEAWLRSQLEYVVVVDGQEYSEAPADRAPEWQGYRGWRDDENCGPQGDAALGFTYKFQDDDTPNHWGRHLCVYAQENGEPERLAHLVQKFLRQFRPHDYWTLSYATYCGKPYVGAFGGGALLVTAGEVRHQDVGDYLEVAIGMFEEGRDSGRHVPRLVELVEGAGLEAGNLDEAVSQAASEKAASINRSGVDVQVEYLVNTCGAAEAERTLRSVIDRLESQ